MVMMRGDEGTAGWREASAAVNGLLRYGVDIHQIAKDARSSVDHLREIAERPCEVDPDLVTRLKNLLDNRTISYGPHLKKNTKAIALINQLLSLGLIEKQIAGGVGVGPPFISKIVRGHHLASGRVIKCLEDLKQKRLVDLAELAAATAGSSMVVIATFKGPDTPFAANDGSRITDAVKSSAANRLMSCRCGRIVLPPGISAAVTRMNDDMFIVALDCEQCRDAVGNVKAHEFEAIARWFLTQAEACRNASGEKHKSQPRPDAWG